MISICCRGRLIELSEPIIMGILNVTPDSFYANSRVTDNNAIEARAKQIVAEGGHIIDVGACSTRPDSLPASQEEEMERLRHALPLIKKVAPEALISVDTFRADVAKMAAEEFGVDIINDISGGDADRQMYPTVAKLRLPYVLTHNSRPENNAALSNATSSVRANLLHFFANRVQQLREIGLNDIILDPGFGFGKTLNENYELLSHISDLQEYDLPILVGISRKSMITKVLDTDASGALNGTTVLHTLALMQGAHILRVHDVKPAAEAIRLISFYKQNSQTHAHPYH